jgi:hypothetical protein
LEFVVGALGHRNALERALQTGLSDSLLDYFFVDVKIQVLQRYVGLECSKVRR